MLFFWLAVLLTLAAFDAAYTVRMLSKHGVGIEMNPLIPQLIQRIGLVPGVWLGIMGPSIAWGILGLLCQPVIHIYVPLRAALFGLQLSKDYHARSFRRRSAAFSGRAFRSAHRNAAMQ